MSNDQLDAVVEPGVPDSVLFDERTRVALAYADAMTLDDVDDELFSQLAELFTNDEIVELTMAVAWENSSARFNRALRVPSQSLWSR